MGSKVCLTLLRVTIVILLLSMTQFSQISINQSPKITSMTQQSLNNFRIDQSTSPLFINGKLSVLFIGALFCPYCAVESWAIVNALEGNGTFTNLHHYTSAEGNVTGYNFINSTYVSNKIDFQGLELMDNTLPNPKTLQTMNETQTKLFSKYDNGGTIPFLCIGGKIFETGLGPSLPEELFTNQSFSTIQNQIATKSGSIYEHIAQESSNIQEIMNYLLNNETENLSIPGVFMGGGGILPQQNNSNPGDTIETGILLITCFVCGALVAEYMKYLKIKKNFPNKKNISFTTYLKRRITNRNLNPEKKYYD